MAYLELVTHLLAYFTSSQVQLNSLKQWLSLNMTGVTDETYSLHRLTLVEMFNCIVDTVEHSSSVRSYRKFLIANFCYKYIHKTIKLTEHYNT